MKTYELDAVFFCIKTASLWPYDVTSTTPICKKY